MAMLAAPRRKQKVINLRAKNNDWSKDQNKFGQRMLEKMGWSSGKGLGAKEDGVVEHVVARYKNDEKGLGYEDKNDQWTKLEDDYNTLLASLSGISGNSNQEKLHSGVSLEEKSKKSKTRIHYHKFTRGKDVARYSEKDLANIFGKKTLKHQENANTAKQDGETETSQKIFTEKGSMDDYFKSKMSAFKSRISSADHAANDNNDFAFQGFSQNNEEDEVSHVGFGFQPFSMQNDYEETGSDNTVERNTIKSKHLHTNSCMVSLNSETHENKSMLCDDSNEKIENVLNTMKKKNKHSAAMEGLVCPSANSLNESEGKKKKSKKSKLFNQHAIQDSVHVESTDKITGVEVKKKKKKNSKEITKKIDIEYIDALKKSDQSTDTVTKKKRKLSEEINSVVIEQTEILSDRCISKSKKKKKHDKISDETEDKNIPEEDLSAPSSKKLKKKSNEKLSKPIEDEQLQTETCDSKKNMNRFDSKELVEMDSENLVPKKKKKKKNKN